MEQSQPQQAVAVLKLAAELYPNSSNAYDSLGEAFQNSGDRQRALENYRRSLSLDPANQNARQRIADLEQGLAD
jgi:Flp pilus assembly protein TadD